MMQLSAVQQTIIRLLGDGSCHSGTVLGQQLGITRSAVWKQINQLIEYGLPIVSMPNQGYKLKKELILLNEQAIHKAYQSLHGSKPNGTKLSLCRSGASPDIHSHSKEMSGEAPDLQLIGQSGSKPLNLHLFTSIDSTNRFLKDMPTNNNLDVCCAELQTQGRGRFGRSWHSPFGDNVYCSSRWSLSCDLNKLSGLSLVTSLAVVATLKELTPEGSIKIKWPNDILWNDKKLCGSLIEIIAESHAMAQVIIGIGLNVNSDTQNNPLPDKPWCSLYEITQKLHDRNQIIAQLIIKLEQYITRFINHDLQIFMDEWHQYDYLMNKQITVNQSFETLSGVARGINRLGQLILEDSSGTRHALSSGDTSLKTI